VAVGRGTLLDLVIIWLFALSLTAPVALAADHAEIDLGRLAPDFSFVDIDGAEGALSDYRGKVVLLEFWGSWCGPCRADTPKLVEIYDSFNPLGFEIVAIDRGETRETVNRYNAKNGVTWRQVLQAEDGPILEQYGVRTYPTYFLIDRDGKIVEELRLWKLPSLLNELFDLPDESSSAR